MSMAKLSWNFQHSGYELQFCDLCMYIPMNCHGIFCVEDFPRLLKDLLNLAVETGGGKLLLFLYCFNFTQNKQNKVNVLCSILVYKEPKYFIFCRSNDIASFFLA